MPLARTARRRASTRSWRYPGRCFADLARCLRECRVEVRRAGFRFTGRSTDIIDESLSTLIDICDRVLANQRLGRLDNRGHPERALDSPQP